MSNLLCSNGRLCICSAAVAAFTCVRQQKQWCAYRSCDAHTNVLAMHTPTFLRCTHVLRCTHPRSCDAHIHVTRSCDAHIHRASCDAHIHITRSYDAHIHRASCDAHIHVTRSYDAHIHVTRFCDGSVYMCSAAEAVVCISLGYATLEQKQWCSTSNGRLCICSAAVAASTCVK